MRARVSLCVGGAAFLYTHIYFEVNWVVPLCAIFAPPQGGGGDWPAIHFLARSECQKPMPPSGMYDTFWHLHPLVARWPQGGLRVGVGFGFPAGDGTVRASVSAARPRTPRGPRGSGVQPRHTHIDPTHMTCDTARVPPHFALTVDGPSPKPHSCAVPCPKLATTQGPPPPPGACKESVSIVSCCFSAGLGRSC